MEGLTNFTIYTIHVRAINEAGAGPGASVTALPYVLPSPPSNFRVAAEGDMSVSLMWDAPESETIDGYYLRFGEHDSTPPLWTTEPNVNPDATGVTVPDLINGTTYTFELVTSKLAKPGYYVLSQTVRVNGTPTEPVCQITVSSIPDAMATVGEEMTPIQATAVGGQEPYTYSSDNKPPWMVITSNGEITGTPDAVGTHTVDITATDADGCTGTASFTVTVCGTITVSRLPEDPVTATVGEEMTPIQATAVGGQEPYAYSSDNKPPWMVITSNGEITGTPDAVGTHTVDITATDPHGCTGTASFTVTVSCGTITVSRLPEDPVSATVGEEMTPIQATAVGGQEPYTYSSDNKPSWMVITTNGEITGIPTSDAVGTHTVDVTATDPHGCTGTASFTVTVCGTITVSRLPEDPVTATVGEEMTPIRPTAVGGQQPYAYSSDNNPSWMVIAPRGEITGIPTSDAVGTHTVDITATDADGCTGTASFTVTVCGTITVSRLPEDPVTATVGEEMTPIRPTAVGGQQPYAYSSDNKPSWMVIAPRGEITGTPDAVGTHTVDITATDADGCTGTASFTVTVCGTITVSRLPEDPVTATVGEEMTPIRPTAVGGQQPYAYSSDNKPSWMVIAPRGEITGIPTSDAVGTHTVDITATDPHGCTGTASFTVTVGCGTITVGGLPEDPVTATVGEEMTPIQATAVGGQQPYAYSSDNNPSWMVITTNGEITGTPTSDAVGTHTVDITATDPHGCTGTASFTVTVCGAITVSGLPEDPVTATVGEAMRLLRARAKGGQQPYAYSSDNNPSWMTIGTSGQITGFPTPNAVGTRTVDITATDPHGCTGTASFTVTVGCGTITVGGLPEDPVTVTIGEALLLIRATAEGGRHPYTYSSDNNPSWMTIGTSGQITGFPTPNAVGTRTVDITATDPHGCTGTASFTVTVGCGTITVGGLPEDPVTVTIGEALPLIRATAEGGRHPYTYSSDNNPSWMTIGTSGQITGTPDAVGTHTVDITARGPPRLHRHGFLYRDRDPRAAHCADQPQCSAGRRVRDTDVG